MDDVVVDPHDDPPTTPREDGKVLLSLDGARIQQAREMERVFPTTSSPTQRLTLEDLAGQVAVEKALVERLMQLRVYVRNLCLQVANGGRLCRVQKRTRRALSQHFATGERSGFAECFTSIQNLKDGFVDVLAERHRVSTIARIDDATGRPQQSFGLAGQLTIRSKTEMLDLLALVRNDAGFLSDRLKRLSATQIDTLSSTPDRPAFRDTAAAPALHSKTSLAIARQSVTFTNAVKEQIHSLERKDPLSLLLFNVYAANHTQNSIEAEKRLHVWSTTCAALYTASNEKFNPLLRRVLNEYADLSEWRARPRLELFLRDVLQKGAFLLGISKTETDFGDSGTGLEVSLFTSEAEKFFDQALIDLFSILDDVEGGFPRGSLELGSAILGKLNSRLQPPFRGFLLYAWFFSDYLFSFIFEPESHGALLDHHIQRAARKDILYQIAVRADRFVWGVFDSSSTPSSIAQTLRPHVESMNNCLIAIELPEVHVPPVSDVDTALSHLVLAPTDMLTLIDALCPRNTPSSSLYSPYYAANYTVHQHDLPSTPTNPTPGAGHGSTYLHENLSIQAKALPTRGITDLNIRNTADQSTPRPTSKAGNSKFEQLRKELEALQETTPLNQLELSHENWFWVQVHRDGHLSWLLAEADDLRQPQDLRSSPDPPQTRRKNATELAAIRLTERVSSPPASTASSVGYDRFVRPAPSLEAHFEDQISLYRSKSDSSNAHYWWKALRHMRETYPICCLSKNDTKIFEPLLAESKVVCQQASPRITACETQIANLREALAQVQSTLDELSDQLNQLRTKMWYSTGVQDSQPFENARNVAVALNNMCLPESPRTSMEASARGRIHSRLSSSSLLQQAEVQTTDLMKAPPEHGGPKKLADDQIERTRKWLETSKIDNFCQSEERFHRFCLEIQETVSRLVGETMFEGRFLWSSELFSRERVRLDILSSRSMSGQNATRPPSVISDEGPPLHHSLRGYDFGSRPAQFDTTPSPARKSSFHSFDRWRGGRETHLFDTASTSDSPGRTISTVTSESVGNFWSPAVTQAQSATSIYSSHSRPSSVHNDLPGNKGPEFGSQARMDFLQEVKDHVLSLLLSDLCCPVWSTGCETDAWLSTALAQQRIRQRIEKRASVERLLSSPGPVQPGSSANSIPPRLKSKRSMSAGPDPSHSRRRSLLTSLRAQAATVEDSHQASTTLFEGEQFSFGMAFVEIIQRLSAQANPRLKLRELRDLRTLVLESLDASIPGTPPSSRPGHSHSRYHVRRTSQPLVSARRSDPLQTSETIDELTQRLAKGLEASRMAKLDEREVEAVGRMKKIFMDVRPRTLFRDLQLISAFVSRNILSDSENAKAFQLTGLAALAFKEDVCRTMVGIADKVVSQDIIKRRMSKQPASAFTLTDAAEFWIICAKEGNPIAQRELAMLYVSHPALLQRVSSPMSLSKDIFSARPDVSTVVPASTDQGTTKLALHWMQLAAKNGDQLAQEHLRGPQKPS